MIEEGTLKPLHSLVGSSSVSTEEHKVLEAALRQRIDSVEGLSDDEKNRVASLMVEFNCYELEKTGPRKCPANQHAANPCCSTSKRVVVSRFGEIGLGPGGRSDGSAVMALSG